MKIIVLDYEVGDVQVFDIDESMDADEFICTLDEEKKISSMSNCHWMVVDTLRLTTH